MPSGLDTIQGQTRSARSTVVRKLQIKRRRTDTGLYEDDWMDISKDVIKWGSVTKSIDSTRIGQFKFSNMTIILNNEEGKYNSNNDENSIWYLYGDQQRTLVRVLAYFVYQTKANGIWTNTDVPSGDERIVFSGFISGDPKATTENQVSLPIAPLTEAFRQFNASRLTGYNNSLTASDFFTLIRDQQDSSGNYIFRPFFGNTTTNWNIQTTTNEYSQLNTSASEDILNKTVWDVMQQLSEAENHVTYVTSDGILNFRPRLVNTASAWEFYGPGIYSPEYKRTIKKISSFGHAYTKYYSRVSVKWAEADTLTSYEVRDSQYTVGPASGPWSLGEKTLQITNTWIPTSTVAETIAEDLFQEFSAIKFELNFTTSFIPHLNIFDLVDITYDQTPIVNNSIWDVYNWADTAGAAALDTDLEWDASKGNSVKFSYVQFQLISIKLNLDSLECEYQARRT